MKKIIWPGLLVVTLALSACSKTQDSKEIENSADQASTQAEAPLVPSNIAVGDTAESSLDWAGEYTGTFPCADCEGIKIELELNSDKTYELSEEYISTSKSTEVHTKGSFSFNASKPSIITLDEKGENRKFFVGENYLEARDIQTGDKIDSNLNYTLTKN